MWARDEEVRRTVSLLEEYEEEEDGWKWREGMGTPQVR